MVSSPWYRPMFPANTIRKRPDRAGRSTVLDERSKLGISKLLITTIESARSGARSISTSRMSVESTTTAAARRHVRVSSDRSNRNRTGFLNSPDRAPISGCRSMQW